MSGKILSAHIASYKALQDVTLNWNEHSILAVLADGGEGKTTLLECITSCLTGIIPDDALNDLTKQAKANLDVLIDDVVYNLSFSKTEQSEVVRYSSKDGRVDGKTALQKLVGYVNINPFELKKKDPQEQVTWFKKSMKINTQDLVKKRQEIFGKRTGVNRRVKQLKDLVSVIPAEEIEVKKQKFAKERPVQEVLARRKEMEKKNDLHDEVVEALSDLDKQTDRVRQEATVLKQEIARLQKELTKKQDAIAQAEESSKKLAKKLEKMPQQDLSTIDAELIEIQQHNAERITFQSFLRDLEEYDNELKLQENLSSQIGEYNKQIEDTIKAVVTKVPGIEVREPKLNEEGEVVDSREGVYFEGKPAGSLANTEYVKLAVLMRKAANEKGLAVLIIDDYESVGTQGRKAIADLCGNEGYSAIVAHTDVNQPELKFIITNDLKDVKPAPAPEDEPKPVKKQAIAAKKTAGKKAAPKKPATKRGK